MVDIKKMKASEWKMMKEDLENRLDEASWRFRRIVRTGETTIEVEGGSVPIHYNIETKACYVWNKCSRYSRGFTSIEKLMLVKEVLEDWRNTHWTI